MKYTNKHILTTLSILGVLISSNPKISAQYITPPTSPATIRISSSDGHFSTSFENRWILQDEAPIYLNVWLGLSQQYRFSMHHEEEDEIGFTHRSYQLYYKDVPIDGNMTLLHMRDGLLNSVNGSIDKIQGNLSVIPALTVAEVADIIEKEIKLSVADSFDNIQLVITSIPRLEPKQYVLAYKARVSGCNKTDSFFVNMTVYVDAVTGKIIDTVNLVHDVSVQATAHTVYSGTRNIITDSYQEGYRLHDSARNISTYNFEKAYIQANGNAADILEYTNKTTAWKHLPSLDSVVVIVAGDSNLLPHTNIFQYFYITDTSRMSGTMDWRQGPVTEAATLGTPVFGNIGFNLIHPPYRGVIASVNRVRNQVLSYVYFDIDSAGTTLGVHSWSDTAGNSGTYTVALKPNPALDAHWGIERTYDFYKNVFNRKSYDNRGGHIRNYVNAYYEMVGIQDGAASLGNGGMIFGLGDRRSTNDFVGLDITAHEYSHMVIDNNGKGGLVYRGESGALNESFADILGASVEFYVKENDANWNIGENIILTAPGFIRSMSNPNVTAGTYELAQPDTYKGKYWINTNSPSDYGGVHTNSGIQNYWFYLLCEGGKGTNDKRYAYNVNGIGIEKAQQIAYRNLIHYLTPNAKYLDAYYGSLQATTDLYGSSGLEYKAVNDAWLAVGIGFATGINTPPNTENTSALNIYPNPATDELNIISTFPKQTPLIITNMLGITIKKLIIHPGLNTTDTRSLPDGTYLLHAPDHNSKTIQKLTIIHK